MHQHIWEISSKHSFIHFKVRYLQISRISGGFLRFGGNVTTDDLFSDPEITLIIEANSVETQDLRRNNRIQSEEYLFTSQYPDILFTSYGGCHQSIGKIWELHGNLSIRTFKIPVTLVVSFFEFSIRSKRHKAEFHLFGAILRNQAGFMGHEDGIAQEIELSMKMVLYKKN